MPKSPSVAAKDTLFALMLARKERNIERGWVPALEIASLCRCTPNAVQQAACRLRRQGMQIESTTGPNGLAYRLHPDPTKPSHRAFPVRQASSR